MSKDFYFQPSDGNEKRTRLLNYLTSSVARMASLNEDVVLKGTVFLVENGNSGVVQGDNYNVILYEGKPPLSGNEDDNVFGYSYRVLNMPSVVSSITGKSKEIHLDTRIVWDGDGWITKDFNTGGQFHDSGTTYGRGVAFTAKRSGVEDIVVKSGTNGFSATNFTIEDGASLTTEDDSSYRII